MQIGIFSVPKLLLQELGLRMSYPALRPVPWYR